MPCFTVQKRFLYYLFTDTTNLAQNTLLQFKIDCMKIGFTGSFATMTNKHMYRLKHIDRTTCECNATLKYKQYYLISACFSRKLIILGNTSLVQRRQMKSPDVSAITIKDSTAFYKNKYIYFHTCIWKIQTLFSIQEIILCEILKIGTFLVTSFSSSTNLAEYGIQISWIIGRSSSEIVSKIR